MKKKLTELMREIGSFTVTVGDLTGPLFIRYRTATKKVSKETGLEELMVN